MYVTDLSKYKGSGHRIRMPVNSVVLLSTRGPSNLTWFQVVRKLEEKERLLQNNLIAVEKELTLRYVLFFSFIAFLLLPFSFVL